MFVHSSFSLLSDADFKDDLAHIRGSADLAFDAMGILREGNQKITMLQDNALMRGIPVGKDIEIILRPACGLAVRPIVQLGDNLFDALPCFGRDVFVLVIQIA